MTLSHSSKQTLPPRRGEVATSGDSTGKTRSRVLGRILASLGLLCVLSTAGCTTTTIEPTVRPLPGLPRPDRVLFHDFELTPANAGRNWDILPQNMRSDGAAGQAEKTQAGGAVVKVFADTFIQELHSRGIGVERFSEAGRPPEINTFSIRGRFLSISQADRGMRARIWFYQGTGSNLRLVAETDAVVRRELEFGSAAKEAALVAEQGDARLIAKEVADRVAGYYREQGWPTSWRIAAKGANGG
jgi:hypothetical protein